MVAFVLLLFAWPTPAHSEDLSALTTVEERQVLSALEELILLRQQRDALLQVQVQGSEALAAKDAQIAALTLRIQIMESIIAEYKRLADVKDQTIAAMQVIVKAEVERAARSESEVSRLRWMSILGPIGMVLAFLAGGLL